MYNKSPRFGVQHSKSTPAEVGPYTYLLNDPFEVNRVNVVPFGSSSERRGVCPSRTYTDTLYDVQDYKKSIKGGSSLRNTAKRFVYKHSDIPPPGTYNPQLPGKKRKPLPDPLPGQGRVYFCKVPFTSMGSSPSIPTKRDQNGYDVDAEGKLVKNAPPQQERYVGPASYNLRVSSCAQGSKYSGCHWSRRTSQRTMFSTREGPGPAHYYVEKAAQCRTNEKEEEYREMARRFSFLPRFLDQQQFIVKKEKLPGPCAYNKTSDFDYKPPITTVKKPFLRSEPRFEDLRQRNEAFHRIYETGVNSIGYRPTPSVKKVGFTFTARRFKEKKKLDEGPDMYSLKGFAETISQRNFKPFVLFRPPFDSTVPREINFVASDSHLKPDCAMYPREEKGEREESKKRGHSVFLSKVGRIRSSVTAAPPVSRYAITKSFCRNRDKTSHNKKRLPFQTTAERKTVVLPLKDNPGPADYLGKEGIKIKGYLFDRCDRFKEYVAVAPPPDHYYIHPLYGDSVFSTKNTFNLMIAESILKKSLRPPPKETFKNYVRTLKRKKILKCYTSILDEM